MKRRPFGAAFFVPHADGRPHSEVGHARQSGALGEAPLRKTAEDERFRANPLIYTTLANLAGCWTRSSTVTSSASSSRYWQQKAAALAWRINLGAWLVRMAPATFFVTTAFAVAIYAMRRVQSPLGFAMGGLGVALVLIAVGCWWRARKYFYQAVDARVLIESELRLDTRLTAAALDLVPWPNRPAKSPVILRWQLRPLLGWAAATITLLIAALLAPLPRDVAVSRPSGPPPSLLQAESMLSALKQMDVADPQAIDQLADRAAELARRPADQQYSHSALEAADAIRNQTAVAASELGRGLESASEALQSASNSADMNGAAGRLAAAVSGLRDGAMPANKKLLSHLPKNAADLSQLTPEQLKALAQQLAQAGKGINGVVGAHGANAPMAEPNPNGKGMGPGAGGLGGGGTTAPLMLADKPSDAGPGNEQALSADALKHFALGDKLGTSAGAHNVDADKLLGPVSAGSVATPASGGDAVWVNRLTPNERAALKNFFK